MVYSRILDDIKTCINLGVPERVPIFALGEQFDVRMYGITYAEYTENPEKMANCHIEIVRRFGYDWIYLNPDDYIEFEPLGIKTTRMENIPRTAYEYLPPTWNTVKDLRLPNPKKDGRMPDFLKVIRKVKKELGNTVCVTGRVAAPFSSVALLYGINETLKLIYKNPELIEKTAKFFVELQTMWGKAQIKAGADAIWLGDCVASSHFISPKHYLEFAAKEAQEVSESLKKEGTFIFYHAGEDALPHIKIMADPGFSCLNIGEGIDIKEVKEAVGNRVCLMGNLDPIKVLQYGTTKEVEEETKRIMKIGKKNGGYIFNTGEGIPRDTPEENVRTMIQTAKKHSSYQAI